MFSQLPQPELIRDGLGIKTLPIDGAKTMKVLVHIQFFWVNMYNMFKYMSQYETNSINLFTYPY